MIKILHRLQWFLALAFLQVLVLNKIHIAGYATPFLYIYFILKYNSRVSRNTLMLWAFGLGLTVDMFGDTPGMNAAAATFLAFARGRILRLATLRDMDEGFRPGIRSMGFSSFFRYTLFACILFCSFLLLIYTFSFFNVPVLCLKIVASTVATMLCVVCTEWMGRKKG